MLTIAWALGGCATPAGPMQAPARTPAQVVAASAPESVRAAPPAAAPSPSVQDAAAAAAQPALQALLAHADRLRPLAASELAREQELLKTAQGALAWLQLSLVHVRKQPPELARAQELAQLALADASAEGRQLQPLARLWAERLGEQRRAEEQLERQGRQITELQKRLDQSLERIEALKAIERSLGQRLGTGRSDAPAAIAPAATGGAAPAPARALP